MRPPLSQPLGLLSMGISQSYLLHHCASLLTSSDREPPLFYRTTAPLRLEMTSQIPPCPSPSLSAKSPRFWGTSR